MVAVVQLVERQFVVLDVAGSSPVGHPNRTVGGTQVPLHCSGPGFCLGDAPLAQRQSNGLLIRRFWVRNPGGAPRSCDTSADASHMSDQSTNPSGSNPKAEGST